MQRENQKRKVQIVPTPTNEAVHTKWSQDYVKRVLNVQDKMMFGDQIEVHLITGISKDYISRVVKLKAYSETIIMLMERIISDRAERLKDKILYHKSA